MNILQKISERAAETPQVPLILACMALLAVAGVVLFFFGLRADAEGETSTPGSDGNAAAMRLGGVASVIAAVAVSALLLA